jgi:hypothetical protein
MEKGLTVWELVLVAAAMLPEDFAESDLVMACWRLAPRTFGMRGLPRHPDSKRVSVELSSVNGPVRRGYLERVGPKTLRVTTSGRQLVGTLRGRMIA